MRLALLLACAASLSACTSSSSSSTSSTSSTGGCRLPFAGDPSLPPEVELWVLGHESYSNRLEDGGMLPLMFPPQGGRVAFVGVHARNVDPCALQMTGAVRDVANNQVRVDSRTVNLRVLDGGVAISAETNINAWANIPLCPNQWATRDIMGNPFQLEFTMVERGGRRTELVQQVVPACAEPERAAECRCICRAGYRLGDSCDEADGGTMDAGAADAGTADGGQG